MVSFTLFDIKYCLDKLIFNIKISMIKQGPFYTGIEELGNSSVVLRVLAKCDELDKYKVSRAMNREFKLLFDKNKIEIPFPQLVIHQEKEA